MIWDDSVISALAEQAEHYIATKMPCIVQRISLKATLNESLINLPNYVIDIVSVTWKGTYLDPYPIEQYIEAGSAPLAISSGKPRFYLYNGYGTGVIKLLPAPNETLDAAVIPLSTKTEIGKRLVLEIKRLPDVSGTSFRIPNVFRRRLIKDYVCSKAFLQESSGMNLKASEYYDKKFKFTSDLVREIYNEIFKSKRFEMLPGPTTYSRTVPRPVLPSQFGIKL